MDQLLLTTKLYPPVIRGNLVHRPRLVEQIQAGLMEGGEFARRLTLFSAPAGYGKTTLAMEWLAGIPAQAVWITLDESDNDPRRFLAYLLAGFQQVDSAIGRSVQAMLQSPQPLPAEILLTVLMNDLIAAAQPILLILDDYHCIHNQLIHKQVAFLLEHQPPRLHLAILTREDPLLPISRYLSRGQATQMRQEELRFTPGETAEFLNHTMGLNLGPGDIEELQQRTEGWIAGLQLAALSIQGHPDRDGFLASLAGSHRFILDYLFEEVFERQPEAVQDFLLKTSLLERLAADLCDQVAECSGSAGLLESLERANLFISPLDASREWYRYHHLFQELLRHRLRFSGIAEFNRLHVRASQWFEEHGFLAEAIGHALAAGEWVRSSRLIQQAAGDLLKRGEIATLLGWFQVLPAEVVRADPGLCFTLSWPLILAGQLEPAEGLLDIAEAAAKDDLAFLGAVLTAQSNLARTRGDMSRTMALSQRALEILPATDLVDRSLLALNLGLAYWHTGQNDAAEKALLEAQGTAQASGNMYALLSASIFLGRVCAVRGELRQAAARYRATIQKGGQAPILAIAHLDLAALHYEWNELEDCRAALEQALEVNQYGGNTEVQAAILLGLARLECAAGDMLAVDQTFEKLRQLGESTRLPDQVYGRILGCQVDLTVMRGDLEAARALAGQLPADLDAHPFYRYLGLTQVKLELALGKPSEARLRLEKAFIQADQNGWGYGLIAVRVLQALAAESLEARLKYLNDALQRSQPDGFIRVYADCASDLPPLLREAARSGVHPEYVGQILVAIGEQAQSVVDLVEPLSERELQVLRLMAAGLSNREIAAALVVSLGTIKTHVHHICGKMGVSNRTQAVVQARDLHLI